MNIKRTAIITGATGFVGSHLCRRLVYDDWMIHIIIRPDSDISKLAHIGNRIVIHRHNGLTDSMLNIVGMIKPDVVFHLASLFLSEHQSQDIENLINSNILMGSQLVEAMTKAGCHKMVNTGTSWQHYQNKNFNPVNLYAATKQAFEDILEYYIEACKLEVITLKLFDTYGPHDPRPKLFPYLEKAMKFNEPITMSSGEQYINLVYIDDVVEAFILAAERLFHGTNIRHEDYAVASPKPIRLKSLVELVVKISERSLQIKWGGRPYRKREVMKPWTKFKILPGWEPHIGLVEGIHKTFNTLK